MARLHIAAASATALLLLIVTLQLLDNFGISDVGLLHHWNYGSHNSATDHHGPLGVPSFITQDADGQHSTHGDQYLVGVGKGDITGPVVEINMMGYADPNQLGSGLRQRLYSRAFIIGNIEKPQERFVYLVLDTQSGDTAVRYGILEGLSNLGPEYEVYGQGNIAVTGTHSHSGPGAWLNYLLPQITSKGFNKQSYQAIVDGAVLSIQRAHQRLQPGYLSVGSIAVEDANINRSPFAYLANPTEERKQYEDTVDKTMTMLKFRSAEAGKDMGVLTWFPVHGTSMLGNNTLISGDNKGVAAELFEKAVGGSDNVAEGLVAGFSQSNVGDTSPNILGAYCEGGDQDGQECNFEDSTCDGRNEPCHARGPYFREDDQGAASCYEIGRRQFAAAKDLYDSLTFPGSPANTPIAGPAVKSFHTFQDFSNFTFSNRNGTIVTTCPAALGYSFAAGTTDGPGAFDFRQNSTSGNDNPVWPVVRGFLHEPSAAQNACHAPKPILLDVGEIERPYLWTPNIVDVQLLRVGQLIMIVSPGEATTMAGRRWKSAIQSAAATALDLVSSSSSPIVVLGGPANSYTHYIATEEEYRIQRYEGASTLYGPHTLDAHINLTTSYLPYLHSSSNISPPPGPNPPNNIDTSLNFITPVLADRPSLFHSFGDIVHDVRSTYQAGETVTATFVGANPRNDLRLEDTYAAIEVFQQEQQTSSSTEIPQQRFPNDNNDDPPDSSSDSNVNGNNNKGTWHRIRTDADWSLIFQWRRTSTVLATSEVDISWETESDVQQGIYRIRYFGASKAVFGGGVTQFEGVSAEFEIV